MAANWSLSSTRSTLRLLLSCPPVIAVLSLPIWGSILIKYTNLPSFPFDHIQSRTRIQAIPSTYMSTAGFLSLQWSRLCVAFSYQSSWWPRSEFISRQMLYILWPEWSLNVSVTILKHEPADWGFTTIKAIKKHVQFVIILLWPS